MTEKISGVELRTFLQDAAVAALYHTVRQRNTNKIDCKSIIIQIACISAS